jgi:ABC-2 type transport system ATP-binding protein
MNSAIRAIGLRKEFGSSAALDGLDLDVQVGEVFGFVGPNGAGKTTTIRILLDLLRPTAGELEVLGLHPRCDGVELRRRIGYLPGDLALPPRLTGRQFLADQAAARRLQLEDRCDELADRLSADLDRALGELSLGNRRKIGVIAAFAHRPELLLLDEPTSGLDPLVQQTFRDLVREASDEGRTVFLSSHVLDEVQHTADRVGVLRAGRLVAVDRVDSLLAKVVRHARVTFAGSPPLDELRAVAGVMEVSGDGADGARLVLEGPAGRLVEALALHHPVDLHLGEPDLEDVFLGYYRGGGS